MSRIEVQVVVEAPDPPYEALFGLQFDHGRVQLPVVTPFCPDSSSGALDPDSRHPIETG
jgi:hypothetical protein